MYTSQICPLFDRLDPLMGDRAANKPPFLSDNIDNVNVEVILMGSQLRAGDKGADSESEVVTLGCNDKENKIIKSRKRAVEDKLEALQKQKNIMLEKKIEFKEKRRKEDQSRWEIEFQSNQNFQAAQLQMQRDEIDVRRKEIEVKKMEAENARLTLQIELEKLKQNKS